VQLWFTANNLYLRGFTDGGGTTYSFNDYDLRGAMQPATSFTSGAGLLPAAATGGAYVVLPYGSDYTSMTQAAGRDRSQMPINWTVLNANIGTLSNAALQLNPQNVPRALMFMIQYTSESARFYDTYQPMANIMQNRALYYPGVPAAAQEFENSWSQMSQFGIDLSNGRNPAPLYIGPNAGWLRTFLDLAAHLAEAMGLPSNIVLPHQEF
jgi:hypothetical protein